MDTSIVTCPECKQEFAPHNLFQHGLKLVSLFCPKCAEIVNAQATRTKVKAVMTVTSQVEVETYVPDDWFDEKVIDTFTDWLNEIRVQDIPIADVDIDVHTIIKCAK